MKAAREAYERQGSPEGDLALAMMAVYLAMAPKSNAAYAAYGAARKLVADSGSLPVPLALRNAPTKLMKELGYGAKYQYDPDLEGGIAYDQQCFPDELGERQLYRPTSNGIEARIREKLDQIRAERAKAVAR